MSAKFKVRLLVICASSGEGAFAYLKRKSDGTHSLTYSEDVGSRSEGEEWVRRQLRESFGRRDAERLMERSESFFIIDENSMELNFGVLVPHGQIPNAIGACKKKTPHLLEAVARDVKIAAPGEEYDGPGLYMSAAAIAVIQKTAEKFRPKQTERRVPATV